MPEINLPATVQSINDGLAFLHEQIGQDHQELMGHVDLAVEELMVNSALYAYADDAHKNHPKHGQFILGCRWVNIDGTKQFCVWLRDFGRPFDPFSQTKEPNVNLPLEERQLGGLGVHLIKHVSNHYIYSSSDGSNTVELYFDLGHQL